MTIFAQRLKSLREQHNLTQQDIADIVHATNKAVSTWENGIKVPRQPRIEKLADFFNVSTDYLLGRSDIKRWEETQPATPKDLDRWDAEYNHNGKLAKEVKLIEDVETQWGKPAADMMGLFNSLNDKGQKKAIDNITDLTMIEQYKRHD